MSRPVKVALLAGAILMFAAALVHGALWVSREGYKFVAFNVLLGLLGLLIAVIWADHLIERDGP